MAFRNFVDPNGTKWDVWFVRPTTNERRKVERRASGARDGAYTNRDRRAGSDRRLKPFRPRAHVAMGYENGWLCFESESGEKRRLVWAPEGWESLPTERLWVLCRVATHIIHSQAEQEAH
jgi:hypothetical protein